MNAWYLERLFVKYVSQLLSNIQIMLKFHMPQVSVQCTYSKGRPSMCKGYQLFKDPIAMNGNRTSGLKFFSFHSLSETI